MFAVLLADSVLSFWLIRALLPLLFFPLFLASPPFIQQVVRGLWNRSDVVVYTDCGAIGNMVDYNHYASNNADAAAKALNGGADVDLGDRCVKFQATFSYFLLCLPFALFSTSLVFFAILLVSFSCSHVSCCSFFPPAENGGNGALLDALNQNLTSEAAIDLAVTRLLTARFETGLFDPLDDQVYTLLGAEVINSTAHQDLVLDVVLQGMVLLKNFNQTLPFAMGQKLAVLGPHVVSQLDLFEDYHGDQVCQGGGFDCVRTIAEVFTTMQAAYGGEALVEKGKTRPYLLFIFLGRLCCCFCFH